MTASHQYALAVAATNAERVRTFDTELREQLIVAQGAFVNVRVELNSAASLTRTQVTDLDDRLKESIAKEREAVACFNQQTMCHAQ